MNEQLAPILVSLSQWALGLIAAAIMAIIGSHIRVSRQLDRIVQQLFDHIENCETRHAHHEEQFKEIRALLFRRAD